MVSHSKFCVELRRAGNRSRRGRGNIGLVINKTDSGHSIAHTTSTKESISTLKDNNLMNMVKGAKSKVDHRIVKAPDEDVIVLDGSEDELITSEKDNRMMKLKSKKNKKLAKSDQAKITNYFSPARSPDMTEGSKHDDLMNGSYSSDAARRSETKPLLGLSPSKDKLTNGCSSSSSSSDQAQSTICTRSQSQKLAVSANDRLDPYKTPEKEQKGSLVLNGCALETSTKASTPSPTKSPDHGGSPNSNSQAGPLTPHKIQALNEDKLRLNSHLSPSTALSKLKILSPGKLKFTQQTSKAKRKLPNQNSIDLCHGDCGSVSSTHSVTDDTPARVTANGALPKGYSKPTMRNTQMTEFFPIRRSHRKPKTTIIQEQEKRIEEKIRNRIEDGLKVQSFESKGRGVIATHHFKKGEMVVEYTGDLIDTKEAKERENKYALDSSKGCYMYYFTFQNNQYCIDATEESGFMGRLVNHSRNGNLATKTVEVDGTPHLILIAKNDIDEGTEILYDYGDRSKQSLEHHPWLAF